MNLTIDIGNSRTKLGIFEQGKLIDRQVVKSLKGEHLEQLKTTFSIRKVILSAVGKKPEQVNEWLGMFEWAIELDHETPLPFVNNYQTPETLGRDRLAGVAGAFHLYPGASCLVIDAGTCVTYDLIDKDGIYHGGAISPGIRLRYKAMHQFTNGLPKVNRQRLEDFVGYNTVTCMRAGAQLGTVLEIQGFIDTYKARFEDLVTIFTGGDTNYFVSQLKSQIFAHPNLVLVGLNKILEYNASQSI